MGGAGYLKITKIFLRSKGGGRRINVTRKRRSGYFATAGTGVAAQ